MTQLPFLYPIVNVEGPTAPGEAVEQALSRALQLAAAGVELLQLRVKNLPDRVFVDCGKTLIAQAGPLGCRVIINDRCDIAAACGAAGAHLGDQDLPVAEARKILGHDAIIGYSTHSVEEAARACDEDANYLGFGPVFESATKAGVRRARGIDALAQACAASSLDVVAIGGLDLSRAPKAWRAGAASVAMIREIEECSNIEELVLSYQHAYRQIRPDPQ